MFDWSGKNADKSGKGQGILISYVSGNPVKALSTRCFKCICESKIKMMKEDQI